MGEIALLGLLVQARLPKPPQHSTEHTLGGKAGRTWACWRGLEGCSLGMCLGRRAMVAWCNGVEAGPAASSCTTINSMGVRTHGKVHAHAPCTHACTSRRCGRILHALARTVWSCVCGGATDTAGFLQHQRQGSQSPTCRSISCIASPHPVSPNPVCLYPYQAHSCAHPTPHPLRTRARPVFLALTSPASHPITHATHVRVRTCSAPASVWPSAAFACTVTGLLVTRSCMQHFVVRSHAGNGRPTPLRAV